MGKDAPLLYGISASCNVPGGRAGFNGHKCRAVFGELANQVTLYRNITEYLSGLNRFFTFTPWGEMIQCDYSFSNTVESTS